MALKYHPDRVEKGEKEEAKEKFNIIHNAYSILSDASKKNLYDTGSNVLFTKATISAQWENYLKPVDSDAIKDARKRYQGSILERQDIRREFVSGNGSMTYLFNNIPFMRLEDEMRITEIILDLIEKGEVKKIPIKRMRK